MLPGIRPDEIELIQDKDEKLEAYRLVFKALFEGFDFRQNVAIETEKQNQAKMGLLHNRIEKCIDVILELEWQKTVV